MISRIECRGFRVFREAAVDTTPFQLLVGPNGSGKSSLLDVVALLGDLLRVGLPGAILGDSRGGIRGRAGDPLQLCFQQRGPLLDLAVELPVPPALRSEGAHERARYEVQLRIEPSGLKEALVEQERLRLLPGGGTGPLVQVLRDAPEGRLVLSKSSSGRGDRFVAETSDWQNSFRLPARRLALASLPEDEGLFPVATWVRRTLLDGVERIMLDAEVLRRPSPPGAAGPRRLA